MCHLLLLWNYSEVLSSQPSASEPSVSCLKCVNKEGIVDRGWKMAD